MRPFRFPHDAPDEAAGGATDGWDRAWRRLNRWAVELDEGGGAWLVELTEVVPELGAVFLDSWTGRDREFLLVNARKAIRALEIVRAVELERRAQARRQS